METTDAVQKMDDAKREMSDAGSRAADTGLTAVVVETSSDDANADADQIVCRALDTRTLHHLSLQSALAIQA